MSSSFVVSSRIINFFVIYLSLFYTFRLFSFCIARCRIYVYFSLILHSILTTSFFFFFDLCRLFIIFLSMDFIEFINVIWILFYDLVRVLHSLHPLSPFTVYLSLFVRLFLDFHVPIRSIALIFLYLLSVSSTILFSTYFLNPFYSSYFIFIVCY